MEMIILNEETGKMTCSTYLGNIAHERVAKAWLTPYPALSSFLHQLSNQGFHIKVKAKDVRIHTYHNHGERTNNPRISDLSMGNLSFEISDHSFQLTPLEEAPIAFHIDSEGFVTCWSGDIPLKSLFFKFKDLVEITAIRRNSAHGLDTVEDCKDFYSGLTAVSVKASPSDELTVDNLVVTVETYDKTQFSTLLNVDYWIFKDEVERSEAIVKRDHCERATPEAWAAKAYRIKSLVGAAIFAEYVGDRTFSAFDDEYKFPCVMIADLSRDDSDGVNICVVSA